MDSSVIHESAAAFISLYHPPKLAIYHGCSAVSFCVQYLVGVHNAFCGIVCIWGLSGKYGRLGWDYTSDRITVAPVSKQKMSCVYPWHMHSIAFVGNINPFCDNYNSLIICILYQL